jgi:hypothetical protein
MGGVEVLLLSFLDSAQEEVVGEFHVPSALPPGKVPAAHWIGGWMVPRAGVDGFGEQKISCPYRDSNLGPSSLQRVAIPTELSQPQLLLRDCQFLCLRTRGSLNCGGESALNYPRSWCSVALGGLVVSVLATEPKVRGFDTDRGRWIFKGDKNPEHHFLRRGSKAVGPMS